MPCAHILILFSTFDGTCPFAHEIVNLSMVGGILFTLVSSVPSVVVSVQWVAVEGVKERKEGKTSTTKKKKFKR